MIILGVVLLVAAAVVLIDTALTTDGTLDVHVFGWHLGAMGPGRALVLGAIIGAVLAVGAMAVLGGQARSLRKRRERNRYYGKTTRNAVRELRAVTEKSAAGEKLPDVISMIDKLAKKGVIHKNKASNLKSKLTKKVAALA